VATIKAECPRCGAVHLRVRDLTVRICVDADRGSYRFRCPTCETLVAHDAGPAICSLLVSVGVCSETWHLPAELSEAHEGRAFTSDDLLDFHLLLEGDDWVEQISAASRE
jgi:hypothetical protein